jgi:tRNA A37 threonylcarbamoyladenosine dehydratase
MIPAWLERTKLLLGAEKLQRLCDARILVVGLGGVGAYAAEMIARSGVGRMTIVDADLVGETNINRQLPALQSTIGQAKADIVANRLRDINPAIALTLIPEFVRDEAIDRLLDTGPYDYVVDAIDTLAPKVNLILSTLQRGFPLVSSMGAGAKTDPMQIKISDISKTHHCPLAQKLRKQLHQAGVRNGFYAVFSPKPVREGAMILTEELNKKSNVGTISYMPAIFGCACASVAIRGVIGEMEA